MTDETRNEKPHSRPDDGSPPDDGPDSSPTSSPTSAESSPAGDDAMQQGLSRKKSLRMLIGIAIGAIAGGVFGWLAPQAAQDMAVLGTVWLNMLRMLVIPLIVTCMIHSIGKLGDVRQLRGIGLLTIGYYVTTSLLALTLGMILVNALEPGVGFDITGAEAPAGAEAGAEIGWEEMISKLITPNLFEAAANTDLLPLIIFSLAFAAVLTTIGKQAQPVFAFFEGTLAAIMKLVYLVMLIAPIGIFGLVAGRFGSAGGGEGIVEMLAGLGLFATAVVGGLAIHGLLVLPVLLWLFARRNPFRYITRAGTPLMTAFATASSSATLPLTMRATDENQVDERASRFVLPLGSTINMDGTALYEAIAAMFIAQAWGIELGLGGQVILFATAILSSIGAAGIPEAGLVTMVIVLQAVGLPIEGLGLLLAIDWLLDRFRTAINVWGDAVGAAVVERLASVFGMNFGTRPTPEPA